MPFSDRFQLIGPKRDEAVRTFEAREIATGRPVFVHFFTDPQSPINRALLGKLDGLPEEERRRVLDHGEHEGGIYLVTDRLAEYDGLLEWLSQKKSGKPPSLDVGGAWRIPPPAPAPAVETTRTKFFDTAPQSPIEPTILNQDPPPNPKLTDTDVHTLELPPKVPTTHAPPPKSSEPGEFTKLFAAPVIRPPASPPNPPLANPAPAPVPQPQPPAKEPGEFTKLFALPLQRPAPTPKADDAAVQRPAPAPAPAAQEPGEFTRLIATSVQRPASVPPTAPAAQEPGEFTRMLNITPAANAAVPPKPAQVPGEFTSLFQTPQRPATPVPAPRNPSPVEPNAPQQGEFTQLFRAQGTSSPAAASKRPDSGEFSSLFESPMAPSSSEVPVSQPVLRPPTPAKEVGEFTQIFGKGDGPQPAPAPAPAAPPPLATSNATQVFSVPRPANNPGSTLPPQAPGQVTQMFSKPAQLSFGQAPPAPVARVTEPVPQRGNNSMLPLILLIGGGALLLIALVVYLLMRHTA